MDPLSAIPVETVLYIDKTVWDTYNLSSFLQFHFDQQDTFWIKLSIVIINTDLMSIIYDLKPVHSQSIIYALEPGHLHNINSPARMLFY
jgi:hypothetical protein